MPSALHSRDERPSALQAIPGSRREVGLLPEPLNPAMHWSRQPKRCAWCGVHFVKKTRQAHGQASFCGRSCSAKWRMSDPTRVAKLHTPESRAQRGITYRAWLAEGSPEALAAIDRARRLNGMETAEARAKCSRTLRARGHAPRVRGGNGTGLTVPQARMLKALGIGWSAEVIVPLKPRPSGYPSHYKLDLGNQLLMVGVEVDGHSHRSRRALDEKKDAKLASLGWTVLRFWNWEILDWLDSAMPMGHFVSMTLESHGIRPSR